MEQLWQSPKSVATILLQADIEEIKIYLSHFIVHNLYSNISTLNQKDEQLIYIVTLLLEKEISSLKNINSSFLIETCCGIILEEFNKKKEVKLFFKTILLEIIKKLETKYSSENIILEPTEIVEELINDNKPINTKEYKDKFKLFHEKYFYLPCNEEELNKKYIEYEDENMKDFIKKKIIECKACPNIYLNENLLGIIYNNEDKSEETMNFYKISFLQIIDIIDILFDNFLKNYDLLPYSIRCICKIISKLIKKKFPDAIKIERNKFVVTFIFQKLLFPILIDPSFNSYINECMISEMTISKLQILITILNKLILGKLFEKNHFTPFNWYIIEKMPKLIKLIDNICEVKLPDFIDKLINDELPENYEYDYFKENPNNILYRNICYNLDELSCLVSNAEKCKDKISISNNILSRFQSNIKKLESIKNKIEYEEYGQENSINNFSKFMTVIKNFLIIDAFNNQKINKYLNQKNNKKYFNLKELKYIETEEQKIQNNIIKVKNFFFGLLYNYQIFSKNDFREENLSDIINILKELKNHSSIKSSVYMDNNYIPSDWYINSLLQNLPFLPKNLIENDYEKLLSELESDITNALKELDFDELSQYIEYGKEIEKEKFYYEKINYIINDIVLNKKAQTIIKNEQISVELNSENEKIYQFFKKLMEEEKEFSIFFKKNNENKIYNSINIFIKEFPYFTIYQIDPGYDIFQLMEKRKVPEIIENYSIAIKTNLLQRNLVNEENLDIIHNKIYDYIMEKLYDKLFPIDSLFNDINIFQNCYRHSWIDFSNLIKEKKNYNFDNYLPDAISYFQQFENEKSPRKKLLIINKLFICLYNLGQFNGDKVDGTDDEIILLNFAFIKSKPFRMYSNCKYTELFLGNKKFGLEGSQLSKLLLLCDKMEKIKFEDFFNINESDYIYNCSNSKKGVYN